MHLEIPDYVNEVISTIETNGYEAFVVGGAVRDALLGKPASDWDVTTNAKAEIIQQLFPKHFDTGLKHGTVTVLSQHTPVEVTTYRVDGQYTDHRRPKQVQFTQSITEDLQRRDFTINAIAYNPRTGFIDPFQGRSDLDAGLIRCVGDPDVRFAEDALRLLRALRFSAKLDFSIEEATYASIQKNAELLRNISAERIKSELDGFLLAGRRQSLLIDSGICSVILPELSACFQVIQNNPHHIYDVGNHTLKALENTPPDLAVRYAVLLHDIGKARTRTTDSKGIDHFYGHGKVSVDLARDILNRLKFDNATKHEILTLIAFHDRQIVLTATAVKRALRKLGSVEFPKLLAVKKADAAGQNPAYLEEKQAYVTKLAELYKQVLKEKQPFSLKDLAVNGHDLIELGYSGKKVGDILQLLLDKVLENPTLNDKQTLLNLLNKR